MPPEDNPAILGNSRPVGKFGRRIRAIFFLVVGLLALLFLISVFSTPLNRSHTEPRVKSASNLRQIGQGILLYCNDHGGAFPDTFQAILLDGDITSDVFVSPMGSDTRAVDPTMQATADQLTEGGHLSYVYLGRGLTTKTVTDDTIVAYEKLSIAGYGANVLFGDGHVEWRDAAFVAKIVDRAASGKFPVTMPAE
jgi:prepilin-type processing-associated H-X9-DG protein